MIETRMAASDWPAVGILATITCNLSLPAFLDNFLTGRVSLTEDFLATLVITGPFRSRPILLVIFTVTRDRGTLSNREILS